MEVLFSHLDRNRDGLIDQHDFTSSFSESKSTSIMILSLLDTHIEYIKDVVLKY